MLSKYFAQHHWHLWHLLTTETENAVMFRNTAVHLRQVYNWHMIGINDLLITPELI